MPEYFFHVRLEVFTEKDNIRNSGGQIEQIWPGGQRTLAPFLKPTTSKSTPGHPSHRSSSSTDPKTPATGQSPFPSISQASCERLMTPDFPHSNSDDRRIDTITIEGTDMADSQQLHHGHGAEEDIVTKGIGSAISGLKTKGRYIPLDKKTTDSAWGIVHLYRDAEETRGLSDEAHGDISKAQHHGDKKSAVVPSDQECTTLCILAVPSYLGPSDFLGFVGEETRDAVSHFRMIKTARANRYMVLMKFRNGKKARQWQQEWNGKVFNSMEVRSTTNPPALGLTNFCSQKHVMSSSYHLLLSLLLHPLRPSLL